MDVQEKKNLPEMPDKEAQEIDLIELVRQVWAERKFLLKCCGMAVIVGLVVAFSIPKEYTTTVKLAPEVSDPSRKMGNFGGLAAMAGINLNSQMGTDAISPDLYPDVVSSIPFLLELFPVEVKDKNDELGTTLYAYMQEHQKMAWWGYLIGIPGKTLAAVKSLFTREEKETKGLDPYRLTAEQTGVIMSLQKRISASVDNKTMVITVSVQMQDPLISADITKIVVEKLQSYITNYRTQKVKQDLVFTEKVFAEAKQSYYEAQKAYAVFEDGNKNIISASYRTEQERLRNEMTLTFNLYNTLAQKLEQDKLRVQEQTPVYTVLSPATVPIRASFPKKPLILAGFVFLAFFGGVSFVFVKNILHKDITDMS